MTIGSVEPLKKLYACWGDQVQFVDILVRQAHPGPKVPTYHHFEEKRRDAQRYQQEEQIPWPVLVDDLAGTTHQAYGTLFDPTYLLDEEGRVAFYNMITYAPVLHEAIAALLAQGGRGVVLEGLTRELHIAPSLTDGWRGLQRGLPQSFTDMMRAAPGSPLPFWLGYQLKPLLAPLTLRVTPLPGPVKAGLLLGSVLAAALVVRSLTKA